MQHSGHAMFLLLKLEQGDMAVIIVIHDGDQQQHEYFWNTGYHVVN